MTDILPPAGWPNVRQLETNEFATGGANGNMNEQAKSLAARSELLKQYAALPYESKTGGYALNERVQLATGDIVRSTIPSNVNNPNENMTGWVLVNSDSQIKTWSGRTQESVNKRRYYIEDFGGVGDGVFDNKTAFDTAFSTLKDGDTLWLADGGVYFTSDINPILKSISIKSEGRATFKQSKANATGILYQGEYIKQTALRSAQYTNTRQWYLSDVTSIKIGDLFTVKSSASWYFDPRPESTDARKSELHRVIRVDTINNIVETEIPANDGYPTTETVEILIYRPITATVENLDVINTVRGVRQGSGIRFKNGYNCKIIDCTVKDYGSMPTGFDGCYRSNITNTTVSGCVEDSTYATKIVGSTLCFAIGCHYYENYAAVDISGFNIISLLCGAVRCTVTGGGYNNAGLALGYKDGVWGVSFRGLGTHSPVDRCIFTANTLIDCGTGGIIARGRNVVINDNVFYGRYFYGCIRLYSGEGAIIANNVINSSFYAGKDTGVQTGLGNVHTHYPPAFINISNDWTTEIRAQTIIKSNTLTLNTAIVDIGGNVSGNLNHLVVEDNNITVATASSTGVFHGVRMRPATTGSVTLGSGFIYRNNTVNKVFPNSTYRILDASISVVKGVIIESDGTSVEENSITLAGAVGWTDPLLRNYRARFSGSVMDVQFVVSGGTVTAASGATYSADFSVPYLASNSGSLQVVGAASGLKITAMPTQQSTTNKVRLLVSRVGEDTHDQIRGYFTYPIGS